MARIPKTLVLTHFPAGSRNGTIRHLEPLFERYRDDLLWYSMKSPNPPAPAPVVPYAHGGYLTKPGRAKRLLRYLNYGPWAWRVARRAASYGRSHAVQVVMAVMSGEAIVAAAATARALRAPLALWVSDDPPSALAHSRLSPRLQHFITSRFRSAMRGARSFGVISSDLADLYRREFGVEALVLYKGVAPETCLPPPTMNDRDEIVIGSVGTVNSDENWRTLVAAVRRLNAANRRRFRILHVGELPEALRSPEVECTGWLAPSQLGPALARFDLCFLTLWFDAAERSSARTAFPTKITSYIQSQRPILAFCIPESAIVKLVEDHRCGETCTTPSEEALAAAIERALEPSRYAAAVEGMGRLLEAYSMDAYFRTFETFIGRAEQAGSTRPQERT